MSLRRVHTKLASCRQRDETWIYKFSDTETPQTKIFEDYYEGNMRTPVHFHVSKVIKSKVRDFAPFFYVSFGLKPFNADGMGRLECCSVFV